MTSFLLNDYFSDYHNLLSLTNDLDIHRCFILKLMTDVYKFIKRLSPDIMKEMFVFRNNPYNLRSTNIFETDNPSTSRYGLDTVRSSQMWRMLPLEICKSKSLSTFKIKIRNWTFDNCPCIICRTYIANVGYIL